MALTYGTASTTDQGATGTSPIVVTKPSSTAAGSLLLAIIQHSAAIATISAPAGWTLIQRTVASGEVSITTFYRVCDGTEGSTFSFSASGGTNEIWEGAIVRYEGASATPFDVNSTNSSSSGTTLTASALTTTAADETVTCVYATWSDETITTGGSQTERLNFGSNGNGMVVADFTVASAGTSGAKTSTQSVSDSWVAQQIAWKTAAGGGLSVPVLVAAGTFAPTASNNASIAPGLPAGWAANDIGILWYHKSNNDDLTTPSGWTEILTASQNNTAAQRVEVFVRRLVGGDSAPTLAGTNNTVVRGARILAIRGVPTTGTAESWITASRSNNAASATVTFATVTTPSNNNLLVMLDAYEDDPSARTTPSGWAAPVIATSALGNGMALAYSSRSWPTAGATGGVTWTVSGGTFANSVNVGILLALSPGTPNTSLTVDAVAYSEASITSLLLRNRVLTAVGWGVATLTKAAVLSRALTSIGWGVSTVSRALVASRALAATSYGVTSATVGKIYSRAVSAVAWGVASVAKGAGIPRTLSAVAHGTATLSRGLTLNRSLTALSWGVGVVSKTTSRVRTLTSVVWGVTTITRLKVMARTLNATTWGVAAVSKRLLAIRSLSATAWAVPTVTKVMALTRQLTAVAWGIPAVTMVTVRTLVQVVNAVAFGSATIAKNTIKPRTLTAIAWGVSTTTRVRVYSRSLLAIAIGEAATSSTIQQAALVYKRISGVAFLVEQITGIIRKKRT